MTKPILSNSFVWTSPFDGFTLRRHYEKCCLDMFGSKFKRFGVFREFLEQQSFFPEIVLMGNFIKDRHKILSLCRELGINTIHSEDGFFPHYGAAHVDPLGFCWESSLPAMRFRELTDGQRRQVNDKRERWLTESQCDSKPYLRCPFAVWIAQLTRDQVNRYDLDVKRWNDLITHFRGLLPDEILLVIKPHPRLTGDEQRDLNTLSQILRNTTLLHKQYPISSLLHDCCAVAGVNSTALYEARLMYHKPTFVYGQSWFTNHSALFIPIDVCTKAMPPTMGSLTQDKSIRNEYLDAYTDWFLWQLIVRQIDFGEWSLQVPELKQSVLKLSRCSFEQHGEAIFY